MNGPSILVLSAPLTVIPPPFSKGPPFVSFILLIVIEVLPASLGVPCQFWLQLSFQVFLHCPCVPRQGSYIPSLQPVIAAISCVQH